MDKTKRAARLAGLLYLPVVILGPFVLLYVPGKIFVPADASATAANILAHQGLFRSGIVLGLVSELFFLAAVLALYRLLRDVGPKLAAAMVILILIDAPLALMGAATEVATLRFLTAPDFLDVFTGPQRDALTLLLLNFERGGVLVSELFWGLWLLPLGVLVYRSRFLPRLLGAWLFANGIAYAAISITGMLWPQRQAIVSKVSTPILFGEVALMLWLLVVGAGPVRGGGRKSTVA